MEQTFKENVKTAITATLASPSNLVRSQIASLIAAIAAIEIPRGEWTDLIANLCSNSSNENLQIRLASLQTIGFICEELKPEDLTKELTDQIMLALTSNISAQPDFAQQTKLAINALLHSIPYTSANFLVDGERDCIMEKIFEGLTAQDITIRETAMQCLVLVGT